MATKKNGTKVTRRKTKAVVISGMDRTEMLGAYAGAGNEEVTQAEMALPFLGILQALSPQLSKKDDKYIKDAASGMFHESVSGDVWDGDEGVLIVPCYFSRHIVEWVQRKHGGGFVAVHGPDMAEARAACLDLEKNDLVDTHQHAVLVRLPDGTWTEAIMALKSTGLTPSRQWNTEIARQQREIDGEIHDKLPRWWSVWSATTAERSNDKGTFFVLKTPKIGADLFDMGDEGAVVLTRARGFQELCAQGAAKVDYTKLDTDGVPEAEDSSEVPGF